MGFIDMEGRLPPKGSLFHNLLRRLAPRNPSGDAFYSLVKFIGRNRRLPRKRGGDLNDFLYFFKVLGDKDAALRARATDKVGLRDYVREVLGEDRCVPVTAVLRTPGEVRAFEFPRRCVVKPTHLSGEVVLRREGEPLDRDRVAAWLKRDYYLQSRERNYRGLEPGVLVEPLLPLDGELDVKIHCLRGEPKLVTAFQDLKGVNLKFRYTPQWEILDTVLRGRSGEAGIPRPANLGEMLDLAGRLAKAFFFVRVDLLPSGGRLYVGELTSVPGGAGLEHVEGEGWDACNRAIFGPKGFNLEDFPELTSGRGGSADGGNHA